MHWTPPKVASTFTENSHSDFECGGFMKLGPSLKLRRMAYRSRLLIAPLAVILLAPLPAHAQGSPFDNGFTALQTLFTGTIAKVASLIAIVIGGYQFAHGEPGGKKALAGVAAGTGIAVLAANVLTWLWGV
jgi:type IV secretory pathway VirB2 component (pilin)